MFFNFRKENQMFVKQIIVIRKELKMRRGKEIAQGAHSSMKWLCDKISWRASNSKTDNPDYFDIMLSKIEEAWVKGSFAKVVCQVNSLEELLELEKKAKEAGIITGLITDSGATEFNGIPTITALAIGPDLSEKLDPITKHLNLY